MTDASPDSRPRILWWAGTVLLLWAAVVGLVARVYWQALLLPVVAHALLWVGVVFGTAVVAGRRDPSVPAPEPVAVPEPGTPRRRVPRLEASAAAVLLPGVASLVVSAAGLIYVLPPSVPGPPVMASVLGLLAVGAGMLLLVGRYAGREPAPLSEAPGLMAWSRLGVGLALLVGAGMVLGGREHPAVEDLGVMLPVLAGVRLVDALSVVLCALVLVAGMEPVARATPGLWAWWKLQEAPRPMSLPAAHTFVVRLFCSSANPVTSVFSVLDEALGIDIRSSWALTFVRRAAAPAGVSVLLLGWLTTSLVMVDVDEQAIRERFGRATEHDVLGPGLHFVLPWPVERVRRVSTARVRTVTIGHEEDSLPEELLTALDPGDADGLDEEDALIDARAGDAESRLWAKQHADQEYTLLLGDGRDLITIDALVHYRVRDARAWLYGMQNPEAALRSLAYRAVMERIISQTLDDALGQDFAALAAELEGQIQAEADRHTLGVQVVDVTLGALHPPVGVAADYQGVVSAQILRDTDRIAAEAYRTGRLSEARREVLRDAASAGAFAAERRADAVGEARAFLGLRARVRTAEADYRFRRRMEAMAQNLEGRPVVILDHRLERDGMAIWMQSGR